MQSTLKIINQNFTVLLVLYIVGTGSLWAFETMNQNIESYEPNVPVTKAISIIRNGGFYEGVQALRSLGDAGDSEAYFHLGQIHRLGIQGEKSDDVAIMYYRLSSEMGHKRASLMLANMLFFRDERSAIDEDEAISVWQKYALMDSAEAQYLLGTIYWNGDAGLIADPIRGYGLIWRASQLGHVDAIASEVLMASDLSFEARNRARLYADNLKKERFDSAPLDIELIFDSIATAAGDLASRQEQKPWQINIGFAHSNDRLPSYTALIEKDIGAYLDDLHQRIIKTENGQYLVTYGPIATLDQAVTRCMFLKKKGYDCSADPAIKNPTKEAGF